MVEVQHLVGDMEPDLVCQQHPLVVVAAYLQAVVYQQVGLCLQAEDTAVEVAV